ncbi:MAG TPA: DNA-formamidopyrimidine glycosylase family protein [Acidimicrobiales bacterium]|nr:DNA-formamidopyrimidine glycosylase family protein [Acidimicrobiales bacterium]
MPELPEVEALATFLTEVAQGRVIKRVEVASLSALKTYDPPIDALHGKTLGPVSRRGKFLLLPTEPDGPWLVLHLARSGWLKWRDSFPKGPAKLNPKGPLALRVRFEDGAGFDATEAATEKRLAAYVVRAPDEVEHVATLGPDPLSEEFTATRLAELLSSSAAQIKGVLTDQRVIAGIGNAYSDDALHAARLSPFKPANKLTPDEVVVLHGAVVSVLRDAVERSAGLPAAGLKTEKRSGMRVHGRTGEACPVCGDAVREVSFSTKSLQYCATCQTGGKPLADRRLSRLLK